MAAFRQTLTVQSQVAQNVQSDTTTLSTLVTASQGAVGSLQVSQATNQLLALSIKQQLQIQKRKRTLTHSKIILQYQIINEILLLAMDLHNPYTLTHRRRKVCDDTLAPTPWR